jgi:hypothetical protein
MNLPAARKQGVRGKNLCSKKGLALPCSKLQGIIKFKEVKMGPPILVTTTR